MSATTVKSGTSSLLVTVLAVFLVTSFLAMPILMWLQNTTQLNPETLRLTQFSTAFGVLGVLGYLRFSGRSLALGGQRPQLQHVLLSILIPAAMLGLNFVLQRLAGTSFHWPTAQDFTAPLLVMIVLQFLGALGEEVGWRGLVQPLLETRFSPILAATITGALFGAGHFYMLALGLPAYLGFILSTIFNSYGMAAVTRNLLPQWRALLAALFHALFNLGAWAMPTNLKAQLLWLVAIVIVGAFSLLLLRRPKNPA